MAWEFNSAGAPIIRTITAKKTDYTFDIHANFETIQAQKLMCNCERHKLKQVPPETTMLHV